MLRPLATAAAALAVLLGTGCGASTDNPTVSAPAPSRPSVVATSRTPPAACPAPPGTAAAWPAGFPAGFPRPPGLRIQHVQHEQTALIASWSSPVPLESLVTFALRRLPPAGYVIGRGDSEEYQTDIPFRGHGVSGLLRINAASPCSVGGYLAVATGAASGSPAPLLPDNNH